MKFEGSSCAARQSGSPSPEVKMLCLVGSYQKNREPSTQGFCPWLARAQTVVFRLGKGGLYAQLVRELTLSFFSYQDQRFGH